MGRIKQTASGFWVVDFGLQVYSPHFSTRGEALEYARRNWTGPVWA